MRLRNRHGATALLILTALAAIPVARAACRSDHFEVRGAVRDVSGRPLADATVHVLAEKISAKEFTQQSIRAKRGRTDAAGRFSLSLTCGPPPATCSARPKHLTVAADGPRHRTLLKVFKFKQLDTTEVAGTCLVAVPDLVLKFE